MRHSTARALTRLYAPSWRRRYGEEFEALLLDVPLTPALLCDVVPRAAISRPQLLGILVALLAALAVINGGHAVRASHSAHVAAVTAPRPALPPCRSYSSLAKGGIMTRSQCLD